MQNKDFNDSNHLNNADEPSEMPPPLPRMLTENLSRNLCTCYDVPKKDIIDAFKKGAKTFDAISNQTYACQGSGCCKAQLERLVETLNAHDITDTSND